MKFSIFFRKMSQATVTKLLHNAETAERRLVELREKLEQIKKIKIEKRIHELTKENLTLKTQVENTRNELVKLEILNGVKQYAVPGKKSLSPPLSNMATNKENVVVENNEPAKQVKKEKQNEKTKEKPINDNKDSIVDVRKLDFRIGKIIDINKHPDADSLYVEKIDCGEESARTVVSGLVNHVPIQEMQNKTVMVLCNLKPVKMRGVLSEAMVMCASSLEKIEVLVPPAGAAPGDLVICDGYPREPEPQLNPKKKIFEICAPELKTNEDGVACYKGSPLLVAGKGPILAPTLKGVSVK